MDNDDIIVDMASANACQSMVPYVLIAYLMFAWMIYFVTLADIPDDQQNETNIDQIPIDPDAIASKHFEEYFIKKSKQKDAFKNEYKVNSTIF